MEHVEVDHIGVVLVLLHCLTLSIVDIIPYCANRVNNSDYLEYGRYIIFELLLQRAVIILTEFENVIYAFFNLAFFVKHDGQIVEISRHLIKSSPIEESDNHVNVKACVHSFITETLRLNLIRVFLVKASLEALKCSSYTVKDIFEIIDDFFLFFFGEVHFGIGEFHVGLSLLKNK